MYHLYPLSFVELDKDFDLDIAMSWGTLPEIMDFSTDQERDELLTAYGNAFKHYIFTEVIRLSSYSRHQYKFSYLRTINDVEVDLIIDRPGKTTVYSEIKSTNNIQERMLTYFKKMTREIKNVEAICLSNDPYAKKFDHVMALPWKEGIKKIFGNLNKTDEGV